MKALFGFLTLVALASCYTNKEIQVEMVNAELVKIDTIYRFTNDQQQLTWRDEFNVEYVSFAAMGRTYAVGTRMMVLRTR